MKKDILRTRAYFLFLFLGILFCQSCSFSKQTIILSCNEQNDLYNVLKNNGIACVRFNTPEEAILNAREGSAVMILADNYPTETVKVDSILFDEALKKKLRLYLEYPSSIPGYVSHGIKKTHWERAVISSDSFAPELKKDRILVIHDCHFVDMELDKPDIVVARVAGFDSAVYGLPEKVSPILSEISPHPEQGKLMVSTTKLSQFITARYAPTDAWDEIWNYLLEWLLPDNKIRKLKWQPIVEPSFSVSDKLPEEVEREALKRGINWYFNAKMILSEHGNRLYEKGDFPMGDRIGKISDSLEAGNGSYGVLEGLRSNILFNGTQPTLWWRRNDCNGEVAGSISLAGVVLENPDYLKTGENIGRWLFSSIMTQEERADPNNSAYGLIGWNDIPHYYQTLNGYDVYYGDDNARTLLGMIMAASALQTKEFNQRIANGLLANLRLSGQKGFQPDRINHPELVHNGWEYYFNSSNVSYSGNFQAYLWAIYLWAYRQTGFELFLERAKTGIYTMMEGYPHKWGVTGIQMDRARMLLPLAWLLRIEDTSQHRTWLYELLTDMEQDPVTGTIPERIEADKNNFGAGHYQIPKTNEEYGATESPIIQIDGDTGSDLLYAVNFAFLGLHEAAEASGDPLFSEAENKLADFLCRIQISSDKHPELDGGWFRGFDYHRWEYWASNGDAGWGAWSIESGWSQSWITMVFSLRLLQTSFWDFTREMDLKSYVDEAIKDYFRESVVAKR
ncbi:hypothetical protein [Proteiniphilum acetatigenes]|uniref:hypothetical protein n=1 Tax=Proteiniphilum acetatigenes TaxID=294710 RepID=UPI00036B637B|nr:hypothetical protein [Proteiniphilum acetatigenes]SFK89786.1 hypothetical protein SAMN05216357_10813 [Porphyromonadaceae bacterium KH3CP3RA]